MSWWVVVCSLSAVSGVWSTEYLLPVDVAPLHYDVKYVFDVDPNTNFSFYGVVDIMLKVKKNTDKIVLHAKSFSVTGDKIVVAGDADIPNVVQEVKLDEKFDFLTLLLDKELVEGRNYNLTIPFYGNLKPGLDGVYISSYVNKKTNSKEYLVTTQFEAISARKGFPCFDEPIYKATFKTTIGHHKDLSAVSNMPLDVSSNENALESYWSWSTIAETFKKEKSNFVWDQFQTSVPMSTYLLAFVVSSFSHVTSPPKLSDTAFRIWARSDAIDQTAYAATLGPKVLTHYEKFFNVSFPLPKQDMFAIPDIANRAMENWGLITYREDDLLYHKDYSSLMNKEGIAETIAHEIAHQWFGNLVTMKWWSDLWLNEGFATFVSTIGVAAVEPTWPAEQMYAGGRLLLVLNLDAMESSHTVSVDLVDPNKITEIFDSISYFKGCALIRMMQMFLGEDVFRKALHNYLTKYSYSNADQDDLWAELTAVSQAQGGLSRDLTVKKVMDMWTKQIGYPVLDVNRDYNDSSLTIRQQRYLSQARRSSPGAWWVPLSVLCQNEVTQKEDKVSWLADYEGVSSPHRMEHKAGSDEWVLFNYNMIALYRVNYDQRNWQMLINTLNSPRFTSIPTLGRVQLISDAFALAWSDRLDYGTVLELASYLQRENNFTPVYTALEGLSKIENMLKRSPDYGAYQKFVRKLIGKTYHKVGGLATKKIINGDNLESVKMQVLTSEWACRMAVPGCEENAMKMFQKWMETENPDKNNPIPLDLRRTVYCVAVSRGSVAHWRFALARRRNTNAAGAADMLLGAMACSRDAWILSQYLEMAVMDGTDVRRQEAGNAFVRITSSPVGYYVAKDFIYNRIDDIYKIFSGQTLRLGQIFISLLNQFTTQQELDEFLNWRDENAKYLAELQLALEQAIEGARVNIDWIARNRRLFVQKLREYTA